MANIFQLRVGLGAQLLLGRAQLALELAPKPRLALTHGLGRLLHGLLRVRRPRLGGRELAAQLQVCHDVVDGRPHRRLHAEAASHSGGRVVVVMAHQRVQVLRPPRDVQVRRHTTRRARAAPAFRLCALACFRLEPTAARCSSDSGHC